MRKKWFAFGCLSSIILLVILFWAIGASIGRMARTKTVKIDPNTYLHVKLSGGISEYNEMKDDYFFDFIADSPTSTHEIVKKISFAVHDPNVRGILLEPYFLSSGLANMNEIRRAISKFRQSGKPVYTYFEMAGNSDYFIGCNADRVFMNPSASAGLILTGIGTDALFFKEMLDKIGVEVNVIHAGDYKGAGETFSRTEFSPPVKRNIERLFDNIYNQMLHEIAVSRNMTLQEIKHIYEQRKEIFINQSMALEYNLVDELIFREDMLKKLNIKENQLLSLGKYSIKEQAAVSNNQVAVVYAQGNIVKGSSTDIERLTSAKLNKILDDLQKDSKTKAVVLRVNSPGGSALESEIMLHKIRQLREVKPVVVSMSNIAASGGYYIACDADYIFADDFTITGSIGVVGMLPNIEDLASNIGVTTDKISRGKYTGLLSFWNRPTRDEMASMRAMIGATYDEFKARVAEGRNLSLAEVEEIAQGQIWSSADAKSNQLIDEIGTIQDAILKASTLANMPSYTVHYYPRQKTFMEYFLKERFDMKILGNIFTGQLPIVQGKLAKLYSYLESLLHDPVQAICPLIITAE